MPHVMLTPHLRMRVIDSATSHDAVDESMAMSGCACVCGVLRTDRLRSWVWLCDVDVRCECGCDEWCRVGVPSGSGSVVWCGVWDGVRERERERERRVKGGTVKAVTLTWDAHPTPTHQHPNMTFIFVCCVGGV